VKRVDDAAAAAFAAFLREQLPASKFQIPLPLTAIVASQDLRQGIEFAAAQIAVEALRY